MNLTRGIAIVGSREFEDYAMLKRETEKFLKRGDIIVSGGANSAQKGVGWDTKAKASADAFAQKYVKEVGGKILIVYPDWHPNGNFDRGAGYTRNQEIVENSEIVLAFYQKGRFQEGGTANTAEWARKLGRPLYEFEEE